MVANVGRLGFVPLMSRRQSGVAIVAVLWVVAALTVAVAGIAAVSKSYIKDQQLYANQVRSVAWGDAAIRLALRSVLETPQPLDRMRKLALTVDERTVEVLLFPVSGFVNVNSAPEPLLVDLLVVGGGVLPELATVLAERIIDWRDPDKQALPFGAEDPVYEAAGVPFRTRGGPFEAPEDLLQVLGFDFEIFDRIKGLVTIYGESPGLVALAAPEGVLRVLARGNVELAQAIGAARDRGEVIIDTTGLVQAHLSGGASSVVLAQVKMLIDGREFTRLKWVDLSPGTDGRPWRELRVEPAYGLVPGVY